MKFLSLLIFIKSKLLPVQRIRGIGISGFLLIAASHSWAALPIAHWTQPNGAQIYLVESSAIPMLDIQIDFDAGSRRDSVAQAGLAQATALMLTKGIRAQAGQKALDENAVGEAWADLGAMFDFSVSTDRMSFTLRSLSDQSVLERAVALAGRQLGQPAFPKSVWQRERQSLIAALKEAKTHPATWAELSLNAHVYGLHPYGFETSDATLMQIQMEDMQHFYKTHLTSCRARISMVGAVNRAQADVLASQLLAYLPNQAHCPNLPVLPEVKSLAQAEVVRVPFKSAQAHVLIAQPGFKRNDPDFFALIVGNYILGGGGFVSRLTEEVREKRGLSYSVYSNFAPGLHAGAFTISLQTRPDQANQAVKVAHEVLGRFVAEGPTAEELQAAKDNLIGGFPLLLDSNRKLLGNVANIAWNQLPLNYLTTWTQQVEAVNAAQIKAAFERILQPEKMVTVIVGGSDASAQ